MAWQTQSDTVARIHSLSQEETAQLAVAYKAARKSHAEALVALRGEGQSEGGVNMMAMAQLRRSERGKLKEALEGFLTEEKALAALTSLGTFNQQWDRMTMVLTRMGLGEQQRNEAFTLVAGFVADSHGGMGHGGGAGHGQGVGHGDGAGHGATGTSFQSNASSVGRGDRMANMQALMAKLDGGLASILSSEQLAQWKDAAHSAMGGDHGEHDAGHGDGTGQGHSQEN